MTDGEVEAQKGKVTCPRSQVNKESVLALPEPQLPSQALNPTHSDRAGPGWGCHSNLGHTCRERKQNAGEPAVSQSQWGGLC
jgi:hypothetical protein